MMARIPDRRAFAGGPARWNARVASAVAAAAICVSLTVGGDEAAAQTWPARSEATSQVVPDPISSPPGTLVDPGGMTIAPAAIEHYTSTYGVSEAEAHSRLVDQGRVIDLQGRLEQIDRGVGLVWYDNQRGSWAIGLPEGADRQAIVNELSRLRLSQRSELRPAASSAAAMRAAVTSAKEPLEDLIQSSDVKLGLGSGTLDLTLARDVGAAEAQRAEKQVAEVIEHETEARGGPAVGEVRDQLRVHRSARESVTSKPYISCSFPFCSEMIAGMQWHDVAAQGCTTAFYVGKADHYWVYDPYLLTAGHCIENNRNWWALRWGPSPQVVYGGYETNRYFGPADGWGSGDGGLLRLTNNVSNPQEAGGWTISGRYWNWSVHTASPVRYAYSRGPVPAGTVMCKNGRTTASTCGTIKRNAVTWNGFGGMLESTAYGAPGDSGAPWTQANLEIAIGMTSGGDPQSGLLYGEPLHRALSATGTVIYGYPG